MVNMSMWMASHEASVTSPWQDVRVAIGCPTLLATGEVLLLERYLIFGGMCLSP